jgi:hypothetical protein
MFLANYNNISILLIYDFYVDKKLIFLEDSGIHDERLRREVINYLHSLSSDDFRLIMTEFIREYFVCEEAVNQGYGIEDDDFEFYNRPDVQGGTWVLAQKMKVISEI